ncbi:hypothetical protein M9H77_14031 [Catharanthus roseus]|uniref:Uncharacterized protein n=1 Tax=Catharanthus roseus TaxID=4058 RepID=A0ACC0BM25_CATRO|nr:hypothetical protein M9H77_14031 [Catharanthus roseus]
MAFFHHVIINIANIVVTHCEKFQTIGSDTMKIKKKKLPRNLILHENLYHDPPDEITGRYKELTTGNEWYFFTPRDGKYPNGDQPSRVAGSGYWKAIRADKPIKHNGNEIRFRKALVFYQGKPPKGEKTSWIMHESCHVKDEGTKEKSNDTDMRVDDYILCRIYKKNDKMFRSQLCGEIQTQDLLLDEENNINMTKEENKTGVNLRVYPSGNNPFGYLTEEHMWSLPPENQVLPEFNFPEIKYYDSGLSELDNILIYPNPTMDDHHLSMQQSQVDNPSLPLTKS